MNDINKTNIKYTPEDIDRIFEERVEVTAHIPTLKKGLIMEYVFTFPNGKTHCDVVTAFPIDVKNHNHQIAIKVCKDKIKDKLWEICGMYSLVTGEKL